MSDTGRTPTPPVHTWRDEDRDELRVYPVDVDSAGGEEPAAIAVYSHGRQLSAHLPTEPEDVEALIRAIVEAAGCQLYAIDAQVIDPVRVRRTT